MVLGTVMVLAPVMVLGTVMVMVMVASGKGSGRRNSQGAVAATAGSCQRTASMCSWWCACVECYLRIP
jgi:hypothetical protein